MREKKLNKERTRLQGRNRRRREGEEGKEGEEEEWAADEKRTKDSGNLECRSESGNYVQSASWIRLAASDIRTAQPHLSGMTDVGGHIFTTDT